MRFGIARTRVCVMLAILAAFFFSLTGASAQTGRTAMWIDGPHRPVTNPIRPGQEISCEAVLYRTDIAGEPGVSGQSLTVLLDESIAIPAPGVTGENGRLRITFRLANNTMAGNHSLRVTYAGNNQLQGCTGWGAFTVQSENRAETRIYFTVGSVMRVGNYLVLLSGRSKVIDAALFQPIAGEPGINGKVLSFSLRKLDGTLIQLVTATTATNSAGNPGWARAVLTLPAGYEEGNYLVQVDFGGDETTWLESMAYRTVFFGNYRIRRQ